MPTPRDFEERIRAAAFQVAVMGERDATVIAERVGISTRSLYRVATDTNHRLYPVWKERLTELGFEREVQSFRVRPRGRQLDRELFEKVRRAWEDVGAERRAGFSRRELALQFVGEFGITLPTAQSWIRKFERGVRG